MNEPNTTGSVPAREVRLADPRHHRDYTLQQVLTRLDLPDSPSLGFYVASPEGKRQTVLQTGHVTREELLLVPGLAATRWRFIHITYEWIPIFMCCEDWSVMSKMIDVEDDEYDGGLWATPKGFPREKPAFLLVGISVPPDPEIAADSGERPNIDGETEST